MSLKVTINHGLDFSDRRKTNHRPYDQNLEGSILEYFIQLRRHHLLSGLMLRAKAKEIKNDPKFVASNGWLIRFLQRNKISNRKKTHAIQKLHEDFSIKVNE